MLNKPIKIGLISDTHNLVRPEAKRALAGVDQILHAGDICGPEVLNELREIEQGHVEAKLLTLQP